MLRFLVYRLSQLVLTLLAASFLIFVLVEASPGTVARKMLGPFASADQVRMLHERLKLGDPILVRYGRWLGVLLGIVNDPLADPELKLSLRNSRGTRYFGNFGFSTQMKRPVSEVLWERLGNSLLLAGLAITAIVPLALAMGIIAALNEGRLGDRAITVTGTILASIPEFASAVILISVFVVALGWLPGTSPMYASGRWPVYFQLILPVTVLALYVTAYVARFVRTAFIEVMAKPYIRTAILKGLPFRTVVLGHAFRNAMIAPFTVILLQINWLLSGVVVTEVVFAYPGIGRLLLEAALFGDIAVIEATTLVAVCLAALTQFAGDIGYMLLESKDTVYMSDAGNSAKLTLDALAEGGFAPGANAPKRPLRRIARSPVALVGLALILAWAAAAVFAPLIAPYPPNAQHMTAIEMVPSMHHWLGADPLKRDILSRILWGARPVLTLAPLALAAAYLIGIALGLTAGYFGGWVDDVISRIVDVLLSFPKIVVYVVLIATVGPSRANIVAAVILVAGPGIARLTRGLTLDVRTNDYVAAARTRGESALYIMYAEIFPNVRGPLIVDACMRMGYTIIAIGVLGFLGLGLPPPDPDWGGMVREGTPMLIVLPHMALFPCFAIITLVLGFNLLADGLQELQPRA